jgi:hypothetical protein
MAARSTRQQVVAGTQAAPGEFDRGWGCLKVSASLALHPLSLHLPLFSWPLAPPHTLQASTATPFCVAGEGVLEKGLESKVWLFDLSILPPPYPVMLPLSKQATMPATPTSTVGGKGTTAPPKAKVALFFWHFFCVCPYPLALIPLPLALIPLPCRQGSVPHPRGVPR